MKKRNSANKTVHKEYIREVPGSDTAIVFIHGIHSTPNYFNYFLPEVPRDWSIYNLLLPGHGKKVEDISAVCMDDWKNYVHQMIRRLDKRYKTIYITAYSLGTLLAIEESLHCPKIKAMFFLNVPLKVYVHPRLMVNGIKVLFDIVSPDKPYEVSIQNGYGVAPDKRLWKYLRWFPNLLSVVKESILTREKISKVRIPCYVFQAVDDEFVLPGALKYLRGNPYVQVRILKHSGHFFYSDSDRERILRNFRKCILKQTENK